MLGAGTGSIRRRGEEHQPARVNVLKEPLAIEYGLSTTINPTLTTTTIVNSTSSAYNTATNAQSRANSHTSGAEGGEEEIIIFDKENVNPGVFRRKGEKGDSNSHSIAEASRTETREREKVGEGRGVGMRMRQGMRRRLMEEKDAERERSKDAATGKERVFVDLTGTHAHNDTSY
jgi:hypothetical protein